MSVPPTETPTQVPKILLSVALARQDKRCPTAAGEQTPSFHFGGTFDTIPAPRAVGIKTLWSQSLKS
jgi:hypothetical protein